MKDMNGAGLAIGVVTECCAVATARGCKMEVPAFMAELRRTASGGSIEDYYPSMAQDVLMYKRQTEIDTLNGAIVKYGKQYGIPRPITTSSPRPSKPYRRITTSSIRSRR